MERSVQIDRYNLGRQSDPAVPKRAAHITPLPPLSAPSNE